MTIFSGSLKKLRAMSWNEVFRDNGLKWEEPPLDGVKHHVLERGIQSQRSEMGGAKKCSRQIYDPAIAVLPCRRCPRRKLDSIPSTAPRPRRSIRQEIGRGISAGVTPVSLVVLPIAGQNPHEFPRRAQTACRPQSGNALAVSAML